MQTMGFEKLANAIDAGAKKESSLRRIQRFILGYAMGSDLVAKLVCFQPTAPKGGIRLSIDRTNWKFGQLDINIFMLGVVYQGVAFPLLFTMLPKRGNSNSQERIDLVERFIRLFGNDVIESIVADREFVGHQWLGYLNHNNIRYHIRIRNNFKVFLPHKNKEIKAAHLFHNLTLGQFRHYPKIVRVNGELCYLSGQKAQGSNGKLDFLILVSFNKPEGSQKDYAKDGK